MPEIHVCPLSKLLQTAADSGARHVVTLISEGTPVPRPSTVAAENHLTLSFHDITEAMDDMTLPGEAHVAQFLEFFHNWDRRAPVIVHCWAGVSRSTAGALAALCALRPEVPEHVIAEVIRRKSPEATPNRRFVELADHLLSRNGRMVDAVKAIGRGQSAFEGTVFALGVDDEFTRPKR